MKFTFLGTGTSQGIPVIGCGCSACISEDPHDNRTRASILVETAHSTVLVDCGPDFRQHMLREHVSRVDAVFITHEHNDHIIGLDDLRPFIFSSGQAMKIYAEPRILAEIRTRFAYAFTHHAYPGAPSFELIAISSQQEIEVEDIKMKAVRAMHGSLPILGFVIADKIAYFTDTNYIPQETMNIISGIPVLIIDMLRKKPHHSHNHMDSAVALSRLVGADRTYFIHMSHVLGPTRLWSQWLPENIYASYDGLSLEI